MSKPYDREACCVEIFARLSSGETLVAICESAHLPDRSMLDDWILDDPELLPRYQEAQERHFDGYAERIARHAEGETASVDDRGRRTTKNQHQRDRLITDTMRWILARRAPAKYGDRVTADVNLTGALSIYAQTQEDDSA